MAAEHPRPARAGGPPGARPADPALLAQVSGKLTVERLLESISERLDAVDASPETKERAAQMLASAREALHEDHAARVLAQAARRALGLADEGPHR